jgi:hypothetical protein
MLHVASNNHSFVNLLPNISQRIQTREVDMFKSLSLATALALAALSFGAGADAQTRPQAPQAAPEGVIFAPYAHAGDGDNDGLSREADDCNKGCIDGHGE